MEAALSSTALSSTALSSTARMFEDHRAHLLRVGYRVTGSRADAEDAVQETWLRLAALDAPARAALRDERAWLTTVVARLGLDRLRSAAARRERYVGPWLPEPLLSTTESDDPLAVVVRDEDVRMAAMVVLERLSPAQRVAFVLHEALALPFADIAGVLGCPEATARQHAARARRVVGAAEPTPRAATAEQQAVLARFADALARADQTALMDLLHPDVVLVSDGGGEVNAARRPVVGADHVARFVLGLRGRYGSGLLAGATVLVNGDLGVLTPGGDGAARAATAFAVSAGRITGIYSVLNPAKLPPDRPR